MAAAITNHVYQFKITLKGLNPKIWRRIQVPENFNFNDLHEAIISSMGWAGGPIHHFEMINPNTGKMVILALPEENEEFNLIPEKTVKIGKFFNILKTKAHHVYQSGDGWHHEVMFEKILPALVGKQYPICLEGKMACPIEECLGLSEYRDLVRIIQNISHREYWDRMLWLKQIDLEDFDPERFNPKLVEFCQSSMAASAMSTIFQFKIVLKKHNPKIWRRIQVPGNYNFWDLHVAIQDAMGWMDCHMHQFEILNPRTGQVDIIGISDVDSPDTIGERPIKISNYFLSPNDFADYEYDFGDSWEHKIVFEKILPEIGGVRYPQCIEGEMACPPEDSGGVYGYRELLRILKNPRHPEYNERIRWLKIIKRNNFQPKNFNPKAINFFNPNERWDIAFN